MARNTQGYAAFDRVLFAARIVAFKRLQHVAAGHYANVGIEIVGDIPKLGAQADFKIENTGTVEELYEKVDEIIKQIT